MRSEIQPSRVTLHDGREAHESQGSVRYVYRPVASMPRRPSPSSARVTLRVVLGGLRAVRRFVGHLIVLSAVIIWRVAKIVFFLFLLLASAAL